MSTPQPEPDPHLSGDPFWAQVRARHRDLDIVLLGEDHHRGGDRERGEDLEAGPDPLDLWTSLVPGTSPEKAHRWVGEGTTRRRESTLALTAQTPDPQQILHAAAATLRSTGWHVLVPRTGLARVLADRDGATVALVYAATDHRLVMRLRSAEGSG
ncbi:hypothetical protein LQF12_04015 [Ruania suaedae]|uniref:hypothetical protein n=1 Tax=Ruania suaedae TaxID=2897774 RepID=UPI001E362A17|nr:hypothetical protein [Ruania suaedae]UFU03786.1 hypothetical protein LQF12_04015 [Ruania suaedae]